MCGPPTCFKEKAKGIVDGTMAGKATVGVLSNSRDLCTNGGGTGDNFPSLSLDAE